MNRILGQQKGSDDRTLHKPFSDTSPPGDAAIYPIRDGSASNTQAFSSWFVHLPLLPACECLRCWRKWSALKNLLVLLHSRNLWTPQSSLDMAIQSKTAPVGSVSWPCSGALEMSAFVFALPTPHKQPGILLGFWYVDPCTRGVPFRVLGS
jgi:hypothetical protein